MAEADIVNIYNQVNLLLEEGKRIESMDEGSTLSKRMNLIYDSVRDELLEAFPWKMARTRLKIAAMTDAPAFGWLYQYALPNDCLKMLPLRENGAFEGKPVPYDMESLVTDPDNPETSRVRVILTNCRGPLPVRYIGRVTDTSQFTPLFVTALVARMAVRMAHGLTGKQSYVDRLQAIYKQAIMEAHQSDDVQGTIERPYTSMGIVPDYFEARNR